VKRGAPSAGEMETHVKDASRWNEVASSMDYGYAARQTYGHQRPRSTPELEAKLRSEWMSAQDQATRDWKASVANVRRAYEYDTTPTEASTWPTMQPPVAPGPR
jgi:hypothetical protein